MSQFLSRHIAVHIILCNLTDLPIHFTAETGLSLVVGHKELSPTHKPIRITFILLLWHADIGPYATRKTKLGSKKCWKKVIWRAHITRCCEISCNSRHIWLSLQRILYQGWRGHCYAIKTTEGLNSSAALSHYLDYASALCYSDVLS